MTDELRSRMVEILPRLRRFAVALTGDLDQGDDLVQETCMRALSRVDQWQPGTRLDSWMYRIAQNLWLDRMRAKKVRGVQVDVEGNKVILRGEVNSAQDVRMASVIARLEPGVRKVENQLTIREPAPAVE